MGVGSTKGHRALNLSIIKNIVTAWVLTIPVCMAIAATLSFVLPL